MYCPSCGSEQMQGLKYCNRCGANLTPSSNVSHAKLSSMIWALAIATALVSIGGLTMIFIFAMEYMSRGDSSGRSLAFLIFFLLVILAIAALLIRQLSRLLTVYLQSGDAPKPQPQPQQPIQSGNLGSARLPEPREPALDSAEQTTRRLESPLGEQKR